MLKNLWKVIPLVMLSGILLVTGCGTPEGYMAEENDTVVVHYKGTLADGTQFDSSEGREPLEFILGAGQMIPGFEAAVYGMKAGETKTVTIPADEAYGQRREDLVMVVPIEDLPEGLEPEVGRQLQMTQQDGSIMIVTISEVTDTTFSIDANHALAGEDLTFEIELVEIK